jgi:hypothetical protein
MDDHRLAGSVVPTRTLTARDVAAMWALFGRLYDAVDERRFRDDLAEKDWVLLLREHAAGASDGAIRGFSTILTLEVAVAGTAVDVIFSGDTGIDPGFWGRQELVRAWARFMGARRAARPGRRLYWFLISKGYRTYLYLPLFFHAYYPRPDTPTPPFERALVDTLGRARYPDDFRPERGVIEFRHSHGHLKPELAEIPAHRRADPHVHFFLGLNPGYTRGHELACVAEIAPENMKGLARRMLLVGAGPAAEPETAGALAAVGQEHVREIEAGPGSSRACRALGGVGGHFGAPHVNG